MTKLIWSAWIFAIAGCGSAASDKQTGDVSNVKPFEILNLSVKDADALAKIPCNCLVKEYPYRLGQTIGSEAELGTPSKLHPAFYGCTNWNGSVQAFLTLTKLLKKFPQMEKSDSIRLLLSTRLSAENIMGEVEYFKGRYSKPFQRTAGWNSYLQLSKELSTWNDSLARTLATNLEPLTSHIVKNYLEFLPKVAYPSRGTAAGFSIAYDYAVEAKNDSLKQMITNRSKDFFGKDVDYELTFEPSEQDFITAGLQEVDIMRRVLSKDEFRAWLSKFLPNLSDKNFTLIPARDTLAEKKTGKQTDSVAGTKTGGKARPKRTAEPEIHPDLKDENIPLMDRLNFSRAFALIGIADDLPEYEHLRRVAYEHIIYSMPNAVAKNETKLKLLQMMFWY